MLASHHIRQVHRPPLSGRCGRDPWRRRCAQSRQTSASRLRNYVDGHVRLSDMAGSSRARWAALPYGIARKASFVGADLTSVVARCAFDRADFSGADLRLATLRASFKMCSFAGANLRGADLRGASFAGCNLSGADLRDADLRNARFTYVSTGSDNGRTDVTGALFDGANLAGATFDRVIGYQQGETT